MASTSPAEIALLHELVAIPSVSGDEEAIARFIEATVRGWGLDVVRDATGVKVELRARKPGPTLALVSHVDVVPPGQGWTRDPWTPVVEEGRLYGRGSGDAKASVAAMLYAMRDVAESGGPAHGRLLVILGFGEETKHTSMPDALATVGTVDAALVGEPTNLELSVAQRGLMMVDLHRARRPAARRLRRWCQLHQCRHRARARPAQAGDALPGAGAPGAGSRDDHADDGGGGHQPERDAAGGQGGARHPQHAELVARGDRRGDAARHSNRRSW